MELLCLILLFFGWITPGQTQGQVVVKEGQDVVLPCSLSTKENIQTKLFDWKKDRQEVFFYSGGDYSGHGITGQDKQFEGRVSHFNEELKNGNASIKITETKVSDSGVYACIFPRLSQEFTIELVVAASPKPNTRILNQTQDWALLQCEVRGASPETKLEWRDSSGNLLPAEETQRSITGGKHHLTIQANVTKSGEYLCVLKQEKIHHEVTAKTFVFISAASPKPNTRILNQTQDWALLQCEVLGASPEPKLEWRDSSGNILPAEETQRSITGGKYDLTIQANVTKSGEYLCVVKQEKIHHEVTAKTFVFISEKVSEDSSVKVLIGWFGGMAVGVIFLAVVEALALRWIPSFRYRDSPRSGQDSGIPLNSSNDSTT
ncbi:programmed cell death 1 ligand 1-like [Tautogolabrus adspersus]